MQFLKRVFFGAAIVSIWSAFGVLVIFWYALLWDWFLQFGATATITEQLAASAILMIGTYGIWRQGKKIAKTLSMRR